MANKNRWGKLTCLAFGTPLGRYCLERLPCGIHSASEVFQREITLIVWGRPLAEHNEHLNKVLLKIRKIGLQMNKNSCHTGVKAFVFLDYTILF